MAKMTTGRAVVESLIAQGVDTLFGIVSVHTLHIYDALKDAVEEGRLRFIGARHEHALGLMADGYARATGKPGVMLTSSGPGAADSIGALGESYHSSVPLLQITTEIESEWLGQGRGVTHEAKDQLGMFASVTDWRAVASTPQEVPNQIAEAFDALRSKHPRPAVLAIPTDFLPKEADFEIVPARAPAMPLPDPGALKLAAALIAGAKRPVIVVGSGVMQSDATTELRELAHLCHIPVAAADGGKGAFPEDHPLALGTVMGGRVWRDNPVQAYVGTCDVAVVVGTSLPFRSTLGVGLELPENLVQIDIDPSLFGRNYPVKVGLAGDAKAVLQALIAAIGGSREAPDDERAEIARIKAATRAGLEEQYPNELRMWESVRSAIDRDAVVVCDSTVPGYAGTRCFQALEPRTFHHPHGWVSIGYGFAASLGAKVGVPDKQVVCVTGDGGFQYNVQELATAAQYGISPVVLLFNDNAWGVLELYQKNLLGGRYFATDLKNPDFGRLAAAYGVGYTHVESIDELSSALTSIGVPDRLHLIEVATPEGIANFS
jgi:acetolactate synthase-1/2/3 large subunit